MKLAKSVPVSLYWIVLLSVFCAICSVSSAEAGDRLAASASESVRMLVVDACNDIRQEQFAAAIEKLERALAAAPDYKIAQRNLTIAYSSLAFAVYRQKNWDAAAPLLQQAMEVHNRYGSTQEEVDSLRKCYDYCCRAINDRKQEQRVMESLAGEPDDYLKDVVPIRFAARRMPLRVCLVDSASTPGFSRDFEELFKMACADWHNASNGSILFTLVPDRTNCDIEVSWTNKRDFAVAEGEAGHTQLFPEKTGIDKSVISLYSLMPGSTQSVPPLMMRIACLHELGHALGIQGHSRDPRDIMTPAYSLKPDQTIGTIALSPRDKNTISRLYSKDFSAKSVLPSPAGRVGVSGDDPRSQATAINNQAVELVKKQAYRDAVELLERGLRLDPSFQLVRENLAIANYNLSLKLSTAGSFAEAESTAKRALELRESLGQRKTPESVAILQGLIYALRKQGKDEEARKYQALLTEGK